MQRKAIYRATALLQRITLHNRLTHLSPPLSVRSITQGHVKPSVDLSSQKNGGGREARDPVGTRRAPVDDRKDFGFKVSTVMRDALDTSSQTSTRIFYYESENDGLRNGLVQLPKYPLFFNSAPGRVSLPASMMASIKEEIRSADQLSDLKSLIRLMEDVSYLPSIARGKLIDEPAFQEFASQVATRLQQEKSLSFTELRSLLQSFQRFHFELLAHDHAASTIFRTAIDAKCTEALPKLTLEEAFVLSDLWFLASCSRLAEYPRHLISSLSKGPFSQMPPVLLIRLLLAVTLQRKVEPDLMQQLERAVMPHVMILSEAELAVVCAGFFKTQTTPSADFVDKLLSRLLEVDSYGLPNDVAIALFAKFLNRYSLPPMMEPLQRFVVKTRSKISTMSLTAAGHLSGIMETTLQADEDFLFRLCQKVVTAMPNVRLKDVSKVANVCSFFNYRPDINGEDFFVTLLRQAEKAITLDQVATYPSKLIELLAAFAQMGLFSRSLMSFMTVPAFWKNYLGQPKSLLANPSLLQLHYATRLEYPVMKEPIMQDDILQLVLHQERSRAGPISSAVVSLFNGLQTLLKEDEKDTGAARQSAVLFSPLPYAEPMLVVRLKDLNPIPLPDVFLSANDQPLLRAPSDGTCSVIVYHPWWDYTNPLQRLTGVGEMKLRHLKMLGYTVIRVNQMDTQDLSFVRKVKFLRDKLFFEQADVSVPREYISDRDEVRRSPSGIVNR